MLQSMHLCMRVTKALGQRHQDIDPAVSSQTACVVPASEAFVYSILRSAGCQQERCACNAVPAVAGRSLSMNACLCISVGECAERHRIMLIKG